VRASRAGPGRCPRRDRRRRDGMDDRARERVPV